MKLAAQNTSQSHRYSAADLAEIIGVPLSTVEHWMAHGLLPAVPAYSFEHLTLAQTLRDLTVQGASTKKLRAAIEHIRDASVESSPTSHVIHADGSVFVRSDRGSLADVAGQLLLEFAADDKHEPIRISPKRTAREWYEIGVEREADGDMITAVSCYREALVEGGANAEISFSLAHALAAMGEPHRAAERYRQVVELDPDNAEAWNNLGAALCAIDCRAEACDAFRRALIASPNDAAAHYNLADTLDELGEGADAAAHFLRYLKLERAGECAAHARRRIAALG